MAIKDVKCEYCDTPLVHPDNELGFRLYLVEQTKYNKAGSPISAIEHPNHHYYFCDYACLREWVERKALGE